MCLIKLKFLRGILFLCLIFLRKSFQHECTHDQLEHELQINGPEYQIYHEFEDRSLNQYQGINILMDYSSINDLKLTFYLEKIGLIGVSETFRDYIRDSLMPPIQNYLEATLKVPPRKSNLKAGGFNTICGGDVTVPSIYNTKGVEADLVIFLKAKNEPLASYVASASACLLDATYNRPIIGKITYNLARVTISASDAEREQDIVTSLHELTHVLGFSRGLYDYFRDSTTGKKLTNHYYSKTINGYPTTILNLIPLTTRIRNHFGCQTIEGAFLENQGGAGSAGSHFERRIFYNEYMTASAIIDTRITEFSLALLEGTGWYQVNYEMAETITWGKNKGCNFINGDCVDSISKKANYEEFCSPLLSRGCSWTKRAGSSCGAFQRQIDKNIPNAVNWWDNYTISQDTFSDNCPIFLPYSNLDCEDTSNQKSATIAAESYGYGSKCYMATLYPKGKLASSFPYCFKSTCKTNSQGNYFIEVNIGSKSINCTSEKDVLVPGYTGTLSCPDPEEFCGQVMVEGFCRRKCSGRGSCINQECICVEGWSGFDCSKHTYIDQCSRCANGDPLKTTCYGDGCECNPNNATCMCLLGLLGVDSDKVCENVSNSSPEPPTPSSPIEIANFANNTNTTNKNNDSPNNTNTNTTTDRIPSQPTDFGDQKVNGSLTNHESSLQTLILATVLGAIGGIVLILGGIFAFKYSGKIKKILKFSKLDRSTPPMKIKIPIKAIDETINASNQNSNSPELSRRRFSIKSQNDSPLTTHHSPMKSRLYNPSLFQNYSPDHRIKGKIDQERGGFSIHIKPLDINDQEKLEQEVLPQIDENIQETNGKPSISN